MARTSAEREAVAGIFHIHAGDDRAGIEQQRRTDAKSGVGRIGMCGGGMGGGEQGSGVKDLRHGGGFSLLQPGREGKRFKFPASGTDKCSRIANAEPQPRDEEIAKT